MGKTNMPAEKGQDDRRLAEHERLIEATESALVNTREFLDGLAGSGTPAHDQIGKFAADLERKLTLLRKE